MVSSAKKIGVDIVQPIVPEYRVALFDGLAEVTELDIAVQASQRMGRDASVPLRKAAYDYKHSMVCIGRLPLFWQCGLRLRNARKRGDVLVVCGDLHQISSLPLILRARAKGIGVIWWGHHVSAKPKALFVALRLMIARIMADCMLCYTEQGRTFLVNRGFAPNRVFATGNTIDLSKVEEATHTWEPGKLAVFKRTHGIEGSDVLLFCSVLRKKTRLDVLIRALAELKRRGNNPKCVIIGDGEMREVCQRLADDIGVANQIIWTGAIRDQMMLAPWFLSASIFVYPGPIGLSLIHAFSYGLPVVVNDNTSNHGPEYAIFSNGENGMAFREDDPVDLACVVEHMLSDPARMKRMGNVGRTTIFQDYSMSQMVCRFKEAILACSQLKLQRKKKLVCFGG